MLLQLEKCTKTHSIVTVVKKIVEQGLQFLVLVVYIVFSLSFEKVKVTVLSSYPDYFLLGPANSCLISLSLADSYRVLLELAQSDSLLLIQHVQTL